MDYKPVLETYIRKVDKLIHLIISGEKIVTTVDHPFYVQGRGFIEAGNLLVGDKLISAIGENLIVEDYYIELTEESVSVYNFQVEDFHTYFVGDCAVWVHNDQCPVPESRKSEKNGLTYKSHTKHTRGQRGNRQNAGIEPKNSFELFENSRASTTSKGRYTYEESTKTVHRFFSNHEGTEWHWCGSTNQGVNSIPSKDIPRDIKKAFSNEFGVKWKGK